MASNVTLAPSPQAYGNFRNFRRNGDYGGLYSGAGTSAVLVDHVALSAKIDDYVPHFVGGVKFRPKWGKVSAVAAYDAYYQEWATKLRLNINISDQFSLFFMGGYKTHEDHYRLDSSFGNNGYQPRSIALGYGVYCAHATAYGDWGGSYILWAGGQYRFHENRPSINFQLRLDETRSLAVSTSLAHDIAPGLRLITELDYVK